MYEMDAGKAFGGCLTVCVVALVVVGVLLGMTLMGDIEQSRADREWARADAVRAQAAVVEANTARDREANQHREYMFQAWSFALAAALGSGTGWAVVLAAALGATVAVGVVRWLARKELF